MPKVSTPKKGTARIGSGGDGKKRKSPPAPPPYKQPTVLTRSRSREGTGWNAGVNAVAGSSRSTQVSGGMSPPPVPERAFRSESLAVSERSPEEKIELLEQHLKARKDRETSRSVSGQGSSDWLAAADWSLLRQISLTPAPSSHADRSFSHPPSAKSAARAPGQSPKPSPKPTMAPRVSYTTKSQRGRSDAVRATTKYDPQTALYRALAGDPNHTLDPDEMLILLEAYRLKLDVRTHWVGQVQLALSSMRNLREALATARTAQDGAPAPRDEESIKTRLEN
ncbi:hypothetical protein I316_03706 [Kwoniella heveanensis BCC8398]|uniref:Uncharacterized protein n=1 Tax=Kwoniella heveanensis BCC8398 TaxID=1296120 RepID=A0A1B9GUF9_9TREE|nr:hypothetical protein I316_03706 [Kwoniella heveanensis BCC8398]